MKVLIISLLVAGVVCQGSAQYPASGWRPNGPAFELPQKTPQKQYLPPVEPRTPGQYGPPEVDVSVQGLPTEEQLPIFQVSPINGQQYVGPAFNNDIRSLDQGFQQSQFQLQQETYRQFARQKQLEAEAKATATQRQNQPIPRQFFQKTTPKPTSTTPEPSTTTSTEPFSLNQGEILDSDQISDSESKSVEISKQKVQEINPQFLLSPLAQLNAQSQYAPLQLGQIRAPVFFQPATGASQRQLAGYEAQAYLSALPSVLAQQQLARQLAEGQVQPLVQPQVGQPQLVQPNQVQYYSNQFQDQQVIQPQVAPQAQYPIQAQAFQPQVSQQIQPGYDQADQYYQNQFQQQQVIQPQVVPQAQYPIQAQGFQPQAPQQIQPSYDQADQYYNQPQFVQQSYQPQYPQQVAPAQFYQPQIVQNQFQGQSQEGLQSGFDVNQQGNGVENGEKETDDDEAVTVTAVATAFGARTQPRIPNTYGAPVAPRQDPQTSTDQDYEETTPAPRRKSAKLRNRRVRPVFTLDKTGHLVLAQDM